MSESQHIEWKESWRDEYLKWICGFANADGGTLIIGRKDNGDAVGIDNARKLLETIPGKVRDLLGIVVDVNLIEESGKSLLEIDKLLSKHSSKPFNPISQILFSEPE